MRETQFFICLAATIGLILLMFLVIYLLRKRLPTLQKKIFFAQVWLASMIVVLMPLYYHFYKIAMYYTMCLFCFAICLLSLGFILLKENVSNNNKIAIHSYLLRINIIVIGSALLFFIIPFGFSYLTYHALNSDNFYDYQIYIYFITLLYPFFVIGTNIVSSLANKNNWINTAIYSFISLFVYLPFFIYSLFQQPFYNIFWYVMISYVPITILIPSLNLYLADKKSTTNKILVLSSFLYLIASNVYLIFHETYRYNDLDHVPTDLTFSQFSMIGLLNLALIVPFLIMSYALIFEKQQQPAQINHEPSP